MHFHTFLINVQLELHLLTILNIFSLTAICIHCGENKHFSVLLGLYNWEYYGHKMFWAFRFIILAVSLLNEVPNSIYNK